MSRNYHLETQKAMLESYYDERRCYIDLLNFYNHKIEESDTKLCWIKMRDELQKTIDELDIDIQYYQQEIYGKGDEIV